MKKLIRTVKKFNNTRSEIYKSFYSRTFLCCIIFTTILSARSTFSEIKTLRIIQTSHFVKGKIIKNDTDLQYFRYSLFLNSPIQLIDLKT